MAPLPARQPGVPLPGDGRAAPRARVLTPARALGVLAPLAAAAAAVALAREKGVRSTAVLDVAWPVGRVLLAALVLFGLCGFAATRLLLPRALREGEWLWIVPVGACVAALALTVLTFAFVPFGVALGVTLVAGAASAAWAVRLSGLPPRPPLGALHGAWLPLLLTLVALVPLFGGLYLTVIGDGSDAHLAAGTGDLLRHTHPLGTDVARPVDEVPDIWRSKQAIYLALAAVATLAGLETWEALSTLGALVLALAATGFVLVARHLLGAGWGWAALAGFVTGMDRMVLHTGMHPYFNQTWGYLTLPFALVLAWWAVREGGRGGLALLALVLAVGAFAYPLALPIPLLALAVAWRGRRRERRARGEPVRDLSPRRAWRSVYRGPRSLVWLVPLGLVLLVPVLGVLEKMAQAARVVVDPTFPLDRWGGDLVAFFPTWQFLAIPDGDYALLGGALILGFAWAGVRRLEPALRGALLAVGVFGLLVAVYFANREIGWYFHFKVLAFTAPVILAAAVAGLARLAGGAGWRPAVAFGLAVTFAASAWLSGRSEVRATANQIPREIIALRALDDRLAPGTSVRLDVAPRRQLWVAYMLAGQPLCSQRPLLGTNYPHVPRSRAADLALVDVRRPTPPDAVGRPLFRNAEFVLLRLRPGPGEDRCSQRMELTLDGPDGVQRPG